MHKILYDPTCKEVKLTLPPDEGRLITLVCQNKVSMANSDSQQQVIKTYGDLKNHKDTWLINHDRDSSIQSQHIVQFLLSSV